VPAENAGRAFALVLVDELVRHGVRHAVVAPGSRSTPIALALLERDEIDVHVRIDERSAAFLALGIAKASGQVVPVVCTSGSATAHFLAAVMEADLSRVPLLALTADRPAELHGIGANQTVLQRGMYDGYVRASYDIPAPESSSDSVAAWRAVIGDALGNCLGAPAGPVHLNLALREPLLPVDDGIGFPYELGIPASAIDRSARPASGIPAALIARLAGVQHGLIVAGGGTPAAGTIVADLAKRSGWLVIAEPHSCARVSDVALSTTDPILRSVDFIKAHQPDLVIVIGRVGLSRTTLGWLETVPHVVVSLDHGNWDVTRSALEVIDCSQEALRSLALPPLESGWNDDWLAADAAAGSAVVDLIEALPGLNEPAVARIVGQQSASYDNLVVSSSMPIRDLDLVLDPCDRSRIFANRGVSGIDGFVSTAMGVALADPSLRTVALCGDLSLLHDINGLLPGPDRRPDITFVVINNNGGGIFSLLPQGTAVETDAFERLFGTPHGVSLDSVAATYQVEHSLVTTSEELLAAIASHGSPVGGGVRIIEIRTDRAENAALHEKLRTLTI
jgi:2-succinyl-5-enolpyruvyl-6-hydroxy-3-cyclohexene-1-carboxylate synthase